MYTLLVFFRQIADLDPGPDTFNVVSAGAQDIFITKLDAEWKFYLGKTIFRYWDRLWISSGS